MAIILCYTRKYALTTFFPVDIAHSYVHFFSASVPRSLVDSTISLCLGHTGALHRFLFAL